MTNTDDIKKYLKNGNILIGTNNVIKNLKLGKLKKVYLTSNCPSDVKEDIEYYASLQKLDVVQLQIPNNALGTICKKPFSISVLGVIKV